MAFNFPNAPSEGQTFAAPGGPTYVYNAPVWKAVGQGQIAIISDTAPANPANGTLWLESDTGLLFIWWNDGNSSQWVQVGGIAADAGTHVLKTGDTMTGDLTVPALVSSGNSITSALLKGPGTSLNLGTTSPGTIFLRPQGTATATNQTTITSTGDMTVTGGVSADNITDWVAYTPTITGFGTPAVVSFASRRIGDTLCIRGRFTSGTSTAGGATITMGYLGVNGGVTSHATKLASGMNMVGPAAVTQAGTNTYYILTQPSVNYLNIGIQNATASGMTAALGSNLLTSGNALTFLAEVPITGW